MTEMIPHEDGHKPTFDPENESEPIKPELLQWLQSKKDVQFIVVEHSHDDYTWYRDRQASEMREAEIFERVVTVDRFTLEQMITAKDFLEGGGKRAKEKFLEMIHDGKMELIGHYAQPEIFLSPEETMFWMTKLGRDKARELGGSPPEKVAYIPDSFGFPESMPDMMHELGQKTLQFKRGFEDIDTAGAVFWWEGPGGNKVMVMPLQGGYDNAAGFTTRGVERGSGGEDEYYDKRIDAATLAIRSLINRFGGRFKQVDMPHMLFMDGSDFTRPDENVPRVLRGVEEKMHRDYGIDGISVRTGSLGEYSDLVQTSVDPALLQTYKGEMRAGKEHFILRGIDSSRMYLKQAMHNAGTRIYDAGVAASLSLLARKYSNSNHGDAPISENEHKTHQLADSYWEAVRLIQPATQHDAVSGCGSSDSYDVHSHALSSGYSRANQMSRNAVATLADRHDPYGPYKYIENTRGAINLLPFSRNSLVEVPLQDSLENVKGLRAFADFGDGEVEVSVQITLKQDIRYATYVLPVGGMSSVDVRFEPVDTIDQSHEVKLLGGEFENEFYKVEVQANGSLQIEDKTNGTSMHGLIFEEQGDRGDEYNFCPVDGEAPRDTASGVARVKVVDEGPVFTELQIDTELVVPMSLDGEEGAVREIEQRSQSLVTMPISTRVRLIKGVDRIEFKTTIDNNARDHRVRVRFDTPNASTTVRAREPYTMTTREAVPIKGGEGWQEPKPVATSHHQGLLAVGDLAIYTRGLPEYEALIGKDGNISETALTLFRGVGYLSRGNLSTRPGWAGPGLATPSAQMLGTNSYEYALSLRGHQSDSDILRKADDYAHPIEDGFSNLRMNGIVNVVSDSAVVSAMYPSREADAVIVRLYNPNNESTHVKLNGIFAQAVRANGDGDKIDDVDMREFDMPRGIVTVRLV